jgi:hypothetical protein
VEANSTGGQGSRRAVAQVMMMMMMVCKQIHTKVEVKCGIANHDLLALIIQIVLSSVVLSHCTANTHKRLAECNYKLKLGAAHAY